MKIRTQFIITTAIFGAILLATAVSLIITNQQVERGSQQSQIAGRLQQDANELSYLSSAYLFYPESLQLSRWETQYASLTNELNDLNPDTPEQRVVVNSIKANTERLRAVFEEVRASLETDLQNASGGKAPDPAFIQVAWSRMEVQNQSTIFDASRLVQILRDQIDELRQRNIVLSLALTGMFGLFLLTNYVLTYRRTLRSISVLQSGTRTVGQGNLDYAIPDQGNDEVGELSRAFNLMTVSLKGVTASKAELEREIAERKLAEDKANRQKAIQEAINRILGAALESTSEEELGNACLAIAEELTRSKYGFIGEIDSRGSLRDIAISDLGWEACATYDNMGHRRPPGDFTLHGIYGRVILDGRPFFTNDPSSHPDSIGTPEGHPPLTTFLGVPLFHNGKTIGMVALANKDDGYDKDDLDALETLSPAIVQAFMRKRAEEALMRRTADLEASNKELEAFSYSVSHDLRAPLRHIDGFSKILLEDYSDKLDEDGRHYLQVVRRGSQRMALLIDDLLKLSRLTRSEMHVGKVDLNRIAESIASGLKEEHPERRVELSISPGMIAQGDARLLRVAIDNLLANAWKFTSNQEIGRIEFGVTECEGQPAYYVRDNGAGFDQQYAGKLFTPFQRLHDEADFPGTGIGLATVQRIIQRHGGRVWAEGEVDKGATFYFTLSPG